MSTSTHTQAEHLRKPADTAADLHPLIRERWSPRAFSTTPVPENDLRTVLEAARWAPSSSNEQPWRYIVGRKGDSGTFTKVLDSLVPGNQVWAKHVPVLILAIAKRTRGDGTENAWAWHDVGLSSASLVFQAEALGLRVHMMAGFDGEIARANFSIPDEYVVTAALALGYQGDPNSLPDRLREREVAQRTRKPLSEIAFAGKWGEPLDLT